LTHVPTAQTLLQPPQWFESVCVLVHTPSQQAKPATQVVLQLPQ
jgi:hypothetical protein